MVFLGVSNVRAVVVVVGSVFLFCLVLSFIVVLFANAQSTSGVTTVTVGSEPTGVAYDSGKGEIFVTNYESNTVSVISDSNNQVVSTVAVGVRPDRIAYDSGKGEIFVTNQYDNTVSVISDKTNTVIATLSVGKSPLGVAYDPKGEVFVANPGSNTVSVISDNKNTVIATIPVNNAHGVIYDSSKGEIFVTDYTSTVYVISDSSNKVVATIAAGNEPNRLAYDSPKGEVFVTNEGDNLVSVISDKTNTVVTTVNVGSSPIGITYDSTLGAVCAVDDGSNSVSLISDSNNKVVANVTVGSLPYDADYDSGKGEVFVANQGANTVSVIPNSAFSFSPQTTPLPTQSPTPSPLPSAPNLTGTVWVPTIGNGVAAPIFTGASLGVILALIFALTRGSMSGELGNQPKDLPSDTIKNWLQDFVSSKRKLTVDEKQGSPFLPTKPEVLAYSLSIVLLSLSFSYVKVSSLNQILIVLPTILATSIIVTFVKTFGEVAYVRSRGVWTEHKIWYFGLVAFAVTTLAFRVPFSSPTRRVQSKESTPHLEGILSMAEIGLSLVFAAAFFILLEAGFTLIGSTGLAMCIIGAFFDTFPLSPMNGKTLYKYKKKLWVIFFLITLALYFAWLLIL